MTIALQYSSLREIIMRILKLKQHTLGFGEMRMTLNIHQKIILASVLVTFVVFMYEELFHLLVGLLHSVFESVEHILDIGIENLLETHTHETQVIVFYIITSVIIYGLYHFYRFLPRWYNHLKKNIHQQKLETQAQWHALPLIQRFEWWSFFVAFIACYLFFSF
jgi:hypothetical protein